MFPENTAHLGHSAESEEMDRLETPFLRTCDFNCGRHARAGLNPEELVVIEDLTLRLAPNARGVPESRSFWS